MYRFWEYFGGRNSDYYISILHIRLGVTREQNKTTLQTTTHQPRMPNKSRRRTMELVRPHRKKRRSKLLTPQNLAKRIFSLRKRSALLVFVLAFLVYVLMFWAELRKNRLIVRDWGPTNF